MNRLFIPTFGPTDWRRLLADPDKQWKRNKSALEMAVCWEAARESETGIPPEVSQALDTMAEFRGAELVLGFPEHPVAFEGGGHASQNDLWALLRSPAGLTSMTVEAKAGEPLAKLVKDWLPKNEPLSGKPKRLAQIKGILGIAQTDVSGIRYQLLHRTASALKEADRFEAAKAIMIVQSFNRADDEASWLDFVHFGAILGTSAKEGAVVSVPTATRVPLFVGWVNSQAADFDRLGAAI